MKADLERVWRGKKKKKGGGLVAGVGEVSREGAGGICIHGRCRSETAGVCMEAVQGVSLSCAKAYFLCKR